MKAMVLRELGPLSKNPAPLQLTDLPEPAAAAGEIIVRITACGVCHTELDEIEGRTPPPRLPMVLGHQAVGLVEEGANKGQRVGVAWIHSSCGRCTWCQSGHENLCENFQATGRDVDGGYAQYLKVPADFAHVIPPLVSDQEAAPLLCAGAVGYRALQLTNLRDGDILGLAGFGASNHLVLKAARYCYPASPIFVFARSPHERELAIQLGAAWAGGIEDTPPSQLQALVDATPAWTPVVHALKHLLRGGRLVINAIRKENGDKAALLELDYATQLWMEKEIKTVANVTRRDVREFLQLASMANIKPEFQEYELSDANQALLDLKERRIRGAKVLRVP